MNPDTSGEIRPQPGDVLLIVDVQYDFLPGGSLGVRDGDGVIPPLNGWIARFRTAGLPIVATRDWHPADHCSFVAQGGMWPPHCVVGTSGARFHADLALPENVAIVSKATQQDAEAYSAFAGTDLDARLRQLHVQRLFIGGLATDYCVVNTVQDARRLGYAAVVLVDCIRAVDVRPGDGARALAAMAEADAVFLEG
jgi:nicotinamidase/pyrazinamidase